MQPLYPKIVKGSVKVLYGSKKEFFIFFGESILPHAGYMLTFSRTSWHMHLTALPNDIWPYDMLPINFGEDLTKYN